MAPILRWAIPRWHPDDVTFASENLKGKGKVSFDFLFQQNVRHSDFGTVHEYEESMTGSMRALMYFMMFATAAADVFIIGKFVQFIRSSNADTYQQLHHHEQ